MEKGSGVKYDDGKIRLDLISTLAEEEIARVLTFGAKKYSAHNWRLGLPWSKLLRAARGHINSFMRGEDLDDETGIVHLAHAGCCIMFLLEYYLTGNGVDDRWNERRKMPCVKGRIRTNVRSKRSKKGRK